MRKIDNCLPEKVEKIIIFLVPKKAVKLQNSTSTSASYLCDIFISET